MERMLLKLTGSTVSHIFGTCLPRRPQHRRSAVLIAFAYPLFNLHSLTRTVTRAPGGTYEIILPFSFTLLFTPGGT
jgi:hypothetical protein